MVRIKNDTPSLNGEKAILKKYDGPTQVIADIGPDVVVADNEVVFPKKTLPLFVPARLKLAYGYWTEADGSKVLFSRDYKPLWRLTEGRKP